MTAIEQTFVSENNIPTEVRSFVRGLENLVDGVKLSAVAVGVDIIPVLSPHRLIAL